MIRIAFVVTAFLLAGCSENSEQPLYGSPTKLLSGESLVGAICRIQEEFRALPKPLMQRMSYRGGWTSYSVGAAPVSHKGFYRVDLRPEALNFLRQHARLELVASLVPLFIDPEVGGEAAVLLAGIPAGSDSMQGLTTRAIAAAIKESGYKSPSQPGDWYNDPRQKFHIAGSLYGLTNATSRVHKREVSDYAGTLENAIVDLLGDYSRVSHVFLESGHLHVPQPHREDRVGKWISDHGVPVLNAKARAFIDKYRGGFSGFVILPLIPYLKSSLHGDELYMMWLLGMENEYWPAMLSLTTEQKTLNETRERFRENYVERVYANCPSSSLD